ncbi:hypothetical protein SESBI_06644 [Sesbania bispinosa]|nr:hypothetical protein SESBI_06644 [Sesbania bispinosa]
MPFVDCSNVCTHLTLGTCPCSDSAIAETNPMFAWIYHLVCVFVPRQNLVSSSKKGKHDDEAHIGSTKKACSNEVDRRWGYSTELMLYDDPWKIKKILKESDLGNMSRLLLGRDLAQELVLLCWVLILILIMELKSRFGMLTPTPCIPSFSRDGFSSRSYVFIGSWVQDLLSEEP